MALIPRRLGFFFESKRGIEVLTGNLMMIMVMAAVFSSVAFMVQSSSDRYGKIQEQKMVDGISAYLNSKVSETWGVVSDEIPLNLPVLIGGGDYIIQSDPTGNYLTIRTKKGTYRIRSSGIIISRRSIRSSQSHTIGIRDGKVIIDPPPLTEITYPLDGAVFNGAFNVSYRTSASSNEHRVYLDGNLVASSSSSLDGFAIDPNSAPTNLSDGQHILAIVNENSYGEDADSLRFVIDRTPPKVELIMSQIMTNKLTITVTDVAAYEDRVEVYVFVVDDRLLPLRQLDASNFYIYDDATEFLHGGRHSQSVQASDLESRIDPNSYVIGHEHIGIVEQLEAKEGIWDSKDHNGSVTFWGTVSDIAGNTQTSTNITKMPINRPIIVGAPDRKADLSAMFTNDVSGSMDWVMWKDEDPKPGEESRLDFMKAGVKRFIEKMFPEDEAAICSFTNNYVSGLNEIILQANFTSTNEAGKSSLLGVVDGLSTRDGTPLYDALYQSVLWIKDRSKFKAILVLTDGKDLNYATDQPYSSATSDDVIDLARDYGIPIYSIGLGERDKVDVSVLTSLSDQTEGRFYLAPTPEKLIEAYDQIAGELLSGYKLTYYPGFKPVGGEKIIIGVYDKYDRSGMIEVVLPVPEVTPNLPPIVSVTVPNGGENWAGVKTITWTSSDPDGDPMTFDLYFSNDAGGNWQPIAAGLSGTGPSYTYSWDTKTLPDGSQYLVRVVAHDGTNQASDQSDAVFQIDNTSGDGTPPVVVITDPMYPPPKKVKDTITISGTVSDVGSGVLKVDIFIEGVFEGTATLLPGDQWEYVYDTTTQPNGVVTVLAEAYDNEWNSAPDTIQMEITN